MQVQWLQKLTKEKTSNCSVFLYFEITNKIHHTIAYSLTQLVSKTSGFSQSLFFGYRTQKQNKSTHSNWTSASAVFLPTDKLIYLFCTLFIIQLGRFIVTKHALASHKMEDYLASRHPSQRSRSPFLRPILLSRAGVLDDDFDDQDDMDLLRLLEESLLYLFI